MWPKKRLKPGATVLCRLFNTPDKRFYGDVFTGTVLNVYNLYSPSIAGFEKWVDVQREDGTKITLRRKEVKRIL